MTAYIVVTVQLNEWRKRFRRDMIDADNASNDRAVNSLINFETVKFFGMEKSEERFFQNNILVYNKAAWKNEASLYALNAAQQFVMAAGGLACMVLSGQEVVSGTMTVGEFVMIQTYLLQLAQPLAWLGTAWRIVQQGVCLLYVGQSGGLLRLLMCLVWNRLHRYGENVCFARSGAGHPRRALGVATAAR